MPTVPKYGNRKVEPTPLPSARQSGPAAAPETPQSEGAAIGAAVEQLGHVGLQVGLQAGELHERIRREEQDRADEVAVLAADRQAGDLEHQLRNDALSVKGRDTLPLYESTLGTYDQHIGNIAGTLTNDRQKEAFARRSAQRRESLGSTIDSHTRQQMAQYDAEEFKGWQENTVSDAIRAAADRGERWHETVKFKLGDGVEQVRRFAARNGLGPEASDAMVAEFQTRVHAGIINEFLDQGNDRDAAIYFGETKDEIDATTRGNIEKALDVGSSLGLAQRQADAILKAGGTLTEQREKARAIDDPKVRERVMDLIEHEASVQDHVQQQQQEDDLNLAYNIVSKSGGDLTKLPTALWTRLGRHQPSLREYAKQVAGGPEKIQTDWGAFYTLMTLGSNEATRDKFAGINLFAYRGSLGDTEFKQLTELQASIRKGDNNATTSLLSSEAQQAQIIDAGLVSIGLDPSPDQNTDKAASERVFAFRRAVRGAVQHEEARTGKKVTDEWLQSTVDTLLTPTSAAHSHWFSPDEPARFAYETAQAQIATVNQIPITERRKMIEALHRKGEYATDARLVQLFNQRLKEVRGD